MAESYMFQSSNPLEEKCLELANHLLCVCKIPLPLVESIKDINSNLIVTLFESITNYNIPDFVCSENTIEEAHNVQAVIDTLSLDLLGVSLSHITGEDVVLGDLMAIFNLLEIFKGLLLLMPLENEPINSDAGESSTAFSSNRNKSTKSSKPCSFEKNEYIHSKPIKMKRYTKCKNKVIISSDSVQSFVEQHQSPSSTNNLDNNQHQNASKKPISSSAYQNEKRNGVEKNKSLDEKLEAAKENSTFNKLKLRRKFTKINDLKKLGDHQNQSVENLFEKNLETKIKAFLESKNSPKSRALQMKRNRLTDIKKPLKKPSITPCRKSFLLPHNLRRRSASASRRHASALPTGILYIQPFSESNRSQDNDTEVKELGSKVRSEFETIPKRIYASSDTPVIPTNVKDQNPERKCGARLIRNWMDEFPGLKLPNDVLNRANKQHAQQLINIHRKLRDTLQKKTKAYIQAEEAVKKQLLLSNLLKKEVNQYRHLNEVKQQKATEIKIKSFLRDARMQSANMKHYCDEFHYEMRKKMQKRNYTEELVAENVFKEVLKIQQDQVQQLCDAAKESDALDAKHHKNYLDALENLYQTNYAVLTEAVAEEKKEMEIEANAMVQAARKRKVELNKTLQKEVREMQKNIVEAMTDTHFRELDAEQYKSRMREHFS